MDNGGCGMGREKCSAIYLVNPENKDKLLLERVFREHRPALRKFLKARLVTVEDHEDFIQRLFLRLMQKDNLIERLSVRTGSTRSYLKTMLNGMIVDMQRKRISRKVDSHDAFDDENVPAQGGNPESTAMASEELECMHEILKGMDLKYRQVIVLNRFQFKSCRQISAQLQISESTVERRLAIALSLIREGMEKA